jgi:hypothetical protein
MLEEKKKRAPITECPVRRRWLLVSELLDDPLDPEGDESQVLVYLLDERRGGTGHLRPANVYPVPGVGFCEVIPGSGDVQNGGLEVIYQLPSSLHLQVSLQARDGVARHPLDIGSLALCFYCPLAIPGA